MCREIIAIAICAPLRPPTLTFTCGKLHLVATQRLNCDDAYDKCVCYFGTCGHIEKDLSTATVDIPEIVKVRCADCTSHEDAVGNGREGQEILESPLLDKVAVSFKDPKTRTEHISTLQRLWENGKSCPYHDIEPVDLTVRPPPIPSATPSVTDSIKTQPQATTTRVPEAEVLGIGLTNPEIVDIIAIEMEEPQIEEPKTEDCEAEAPATKGPLPGRAVEQSTMNHLSPPEDEDNFATQGKNTTSLTDSDSSSYPTESAKSNIVPTDQLPKVVEITLPHGSSLESSRWAPADVSEKPTISAPRSHVPIAAPKITPKVRDVAKKLTAARAFLSARG